MTTYILTKALHKDIKSSLNNYTHYKEWTQIITVNANIHRLNQQLAGAIIIIGDNNKLNLIYIQSSMHIRQKMKPNNDNGPKL
jgi:hypothetical protein